MRQYIVETWKTGEAYEKGETGLFVKVAAKDASHAEDLAMRQTGYEVVECLGLAKDLILMEGDAVRRSKGFGT